LNLQAYPIKQKSREAELSQYRLKVVPEIILRAKDHHADIVLLGYASSNKPVVEDGNKTNKPFDSKKCSTHTQVPSGELILMSNFHSYGKCIG